MVACVVGHQVLTRRLKRYEQAFRDLRTLFREDTVPMLRGWRDEDASLIIPSEAFPGSSSISPPQESSCLELRNGP